MWTLPWCCFFNSSWYLLKKITDIFKAFQPLRRRVYHSTIKINVIFVIIFMELLKDNILMKILLIFQQLKHKQVCSYSFTNFFSDKKVVQLKSKSLQEQNHRSHDCCLCWISSSSLLPTQWLNLQGDIKATYSFVVVRNPAPFFYFVECYILWSMLVSNGNHVSNSGIVHR